MSSTVNGAAQVLFVALALPSAQMAWVFASVGLKSPACVVPAVPERAVSSKPYDFILASVIRIVSRIAGPPGV
jgi:hypothetical protein